jgi:hypothetical protein
MVYLSFRWDERWNSKRAPLRLQGTLGVRSHPSSVNLIRRGCESNGSLHIQSSTSATNAASVWGSDCTVATISGKTKLLIYSSFSPCDLQSVCIAHAYPLGAGSLISQPRLPWEAVSLPVNEGPQVLVNGIRVWMTYSASPCEHWFRRPRRDPT